MRKIQVRFARFRYRMAAKLYHLKSRRSLAASQLRYRFMLGARARHLLTRAGLIALGISPFVLFLLLLPKGGTATQKPTQDLATGRTRGTPSALAFPLATYPPPPYAVPAPAPSTPPSPAPSAAASPAIRQCSDGRDNDHDGRADYPADRGCTSRSDNSEAPNPARPVPATSSPPAPAPAPTPSASVSPEPTDSPSPEPTVSASPDPTFPPPSFSAPFFLPGAASSLT